jgi:hypothetical protein
MRFDWYNGSEWWFVGLERPETAEGANIDYAHIDEGRLVLPPQHFELAWKTVTRRLRGSGRCKVPVKPGIWITTTPDAPGTPLFNATENPKTKSPNCRIYRWSIFDNPKLPKEFIDETVRTHTGGFRDRFVYGRFAAAGAGTLLFDSTVNVGELPTANIREIRYGIDFGWTNPTAIIPLAYDGDGRAWALDEVYMRHLSAEQIITELRQLQEKYGKGEVYCDKSEPETIWKLVQAGFNAKGYAEKREDGLRELAGRVQKQTDGKPRLFVSGKCVNLISELIEYDEKVKENDHACFVAGTMVSTDRGQVPIEHIRESDLVWTRKGLRPVVASGSTGTRDIMRVSFDDGSSFVGTPDHPIFVSGKGFIPLSALRYAYKCQKLNTLLCISERKEKNKNSTVQYTTAIRTARDLNTSELTAGTELLITFTGTFGNSIMGPFQKDMSFIIKMVTQLITRLKTWIVSLKEHIYQTTANSFSLIPSIVKNRENLWTEFALLLKVGTPRKKDMNGISTNGKRVSKNPLNKFKNNALHAENRSLTNQYNNQEDFALGNARPKPSGSPIRNTTLWTSVIDVSSMGRAKVYNLKVEGTSEFFANGILVHNCDALRYALKVKTTNLAFRFG